MLPSAFVVLKALPLTPNGKVDRQALPSPDFTSVDLPTLAPRTSVEAQLAQLWAETLGRQVGISDDFFELGGHSLLATRLASRVAKQFAVELPLRNFFETTNVADLAKKIDVLLWTTQQMDFKNEHSNVTDFEEMEF